MKFKNILPGAVMTALALLLLWFWHARHDEKTSLDAATHASPAPYEGTFATIRAPRSIWVHCGNSMRPATEMIASEFQRRHGIAVHLNFGGSAELLSTIELSLHGDLYICHDPYAAMLDEKGLLDQEATVASLQPIIIVPKGNPRGVASVHDLVVPGLRLAMPDARYATAGRLVRQALRDLDLESGLDANLVMEGRGHNDVAMALVSGHADAGIVWNFIAAFYRDRLQRVDLNLDIPPTAVTLCLLTTATEPDAARKFIDLAESEFGTRVFAHHGYDPAP